MTSTGVARARLRDDDVRQVPPRQVPVIGWTLPTLLLAEAVALLVQAVAAALSRRGTESWALVLTFAAVALAFAWPMGLLVARRVTRTSRTAAALALALVSTLQWRLTDPLLFTGFDEQLHLRTLVDITTSHSLGQPNPLLEVSPHYPGMEAVAAALEQLGLPMTIAATITILLARVVLVLVLSRVVEDLTGNVRAAGLAVAVYALSQQFFFFNSQFAYQTLAVPLALAAVACIVRARRSPDPRSAMWGSSICIVAVAVTHHITGALLTAFLLAWAISSRRGPGARALWLASLVSVLTMVVWSLTQWAALVEYFGPVFQTFFTELHGSGQRRQAFADSSGVTTPLWERLAILYYAGLVSLLTVALAFPRLRKIRIGRFVLGGSPRPDGRRTSLLIVLPALVVPLTFAARSLPQVGEFLNRATTFVFLALAVLAGTTFAALRHRRLTASRGFRWALVLIATGLYVGGTVLGNGPDWQRLPGQWLAGAENRSMDSETLAAVQWADDNIRPGSRIAADRISGDLLAARARLWVVSKEKEADPASLYFADTWGQDQMQTIRKLHLQYLFVDERLSTQLPHVGVYFHPGETPAPQQLTRGQLTKWDQALGITVAYRHGPLTIYDLTGLDVGPRITGWAGDEPSPGLPLQICFGLAAGLAVLWIRRAPVCAGVREGLRRLWRTCGPALGSAIALSALCVTSVVALLAHLWTGPASFATLAAVVLLGHRRQIAAGLGRLAGVQRPRVSIALVTALVLAVGVAATAVVLAVESARLTDVTAVQQILGASADRGGGG
jgi:hypothetical protein